MLEFLLNLFRSLGKKKQRSSDLPWSVCECGHIYEDHNISVGAGQWVCDRTQFCGCKGFRAKTFKH